MNTTLTLFLFSTSTGLLLFSYAFWLAPARACLGAAFLGVLLLLGFALAEKLSGGSFFSLLNFREEAEAVSVAYSGFFSGMVLAGLLVAVLAKFRKRN